LLPGVRTWKVDAEHGKLPDVVGAFAAYIELLKDGETKLLDAYEPVAGGQRGARGKTGDAATAAALAAPAAMVRSRPSRGLNASQPPSSEADVMGLGRTDDIGLRPPSSAAPLSVVVLNADLRFVQQPLLVGHYRSMTLTGAERMIDGLVDQGMSRSLAAGLYPAVPGSHQIFGNVRKDRDNPFEMARPGAAIVVGLGEEGKLRLAELSFSVRQAVLAYAQRLSERAADQEGGPPAQFELAATLMGSGGTGITPGGAVRAIAQGALDASQKLQNSSWPQLVKLTFIELYLERAGDAWRALQLQEIAAPKQLKLVGKIHFGPGAMRRSLDSSYRGSTYDFISALPVPGGDPAVPCIQYTLDTKRARTEVRAVHAQGTLLRELVAKASNDANTDRQIGRTLFNLLIPVEMEAFLGGTSEMVIELEAATAGIPWELLDTNPDAQSADERPWAIRSKLIRKLQIKDFRAQVTDASPDDNVLVIGEPKCDPAFYPPLDGARREAIAVAARLTAPGSGIAAAKVRALVDHDDAQTIINALFERPYRVVHIAGHGEYSANGGVVLSGLNTYLGANEVNAMRTVPELVFLNCCHLAGRDAAAVLKPYDRAGFAANIAEALIKVGVRCVIAAGWAVEDDAAEEFATSFYASLLGGARFIEAVGVARTAAWNANRQGNTWAAYQCYGDPEWSWRRAGADAQRPAQALGDEFAGVASPVSLALALETIAIGSQYGGAKAESQLDKLRYLDAEFASLWGGMGAVAEAFGVAYAEAGVTANAIEWYDRAVNAQDGSASFKAADQLGNLRVRQAGKKGDAVGIRAGIAQLERLAALQPTLERANLLGSAWKRLAMVEWKAGHKTEASKAVDGVVEHYGAAEAVARKAGDDTVFYPAKNGISAEFSLAFMNGRLPQLDAERFDVVGASLLKAATERPDFWSVVGQTELLMLAALAKGQLAAAQQGLTRGFRELKARVPAVKMWDSVCNEAEFTLQPYIEMVSSQQRPAEKLAAQGLLDTLKELAAK